jgi:hypothetical protein
MTPEAMDQRKLDVVRRVLGVETETEAINQALDLVALREEPVTYLCHNDMLRCMRTTVRLDPQLLAEAKQLAAATGRTLTAVIEEALRTAVAPRRRPHRRARVRLTVVDGHGVQPGVDLDDSAALLDVMDLGRGPA